MAKISEDDLNEIFKKASDADDYKHESEPVKIIRQKEKLDHIESVRKRISNIKSPIKRSGWLEELGTFILKTLAIWGLIFFVVLMLFNFQSIYSRIRWTYYIDYLNQKLPEKTNEIAIKPDDPVKIPSVLPQFSSVNDNMLTISKISVNAPINWDVEPDLIIDKLIEGVTHYKGTKHPGEGGNSFIIGHSSNYFWINSDYNNVFALLDKLENGDRIEISYKKKKYFYDVVDKRVVGQDDVEYLNNTPKETLTLMTCWPVGTTLNRLIIQSELIYSSF